MNCNLFYYFLLLCILFSGAGPAHSSSTVTDILSVPAALDTSLSAPPGDPTLRPPPKHPSCRSRFQDMPPSPKGGSSLKPPLIPLGLGSPTTPKHPSRMGSRHPHSGIPSFQQDSQQGSLDVGEEWWAGEGSSASPQPVRSHLTVEIMQQEEERRASNAQAETSSSPSERPAVTNHCLSSLKGSSSRAAHQPKATAGHLTPFELASQEFIEDHSQAKRAGQSEAHSDDRLTTPLASGKPADPLAAPHSNGRRGLAEVSQHDGQEPEPIGGSSSEADERLIHIVQAAKCVFSAGLLSSCMENDCLSSSYWLRVSMDQSCSRSKLNSFTAVGTMNVLLCSSVLCSALVSTLDAHCPILAVTALTPLHCYTCHYYGRRH